MPVRFKETAEYRQRFSPQATQDVSKNSSRASELSRGDQPLVSILKTSVLPTDVHQRTRSHSDEYVLLGNQSKFAPSIRYRLRPTAVDRTTPQQVNVAQHLDYDEQLISKDKLRLHQATQTDDLSHHRSVSRAKSTEESQRMRRRKIAAKETQWQQNKENVYSHSAEDQPISRQDYSYHRNSNDNSSSTGYQWRLLSHPDEERQEKSEGQRYPSAERYRTRDRGRETEGQRDPSSAERHRTRDRGRETEGQRDPSSAERHRTRDRGRETEGQRDQSAERYRDRGRETEGQRDPSAERYRARDRGRETEGQRDQSTERYRDRGRETEGQRDPSSAERHRTRDRGRETEGQRDQSSAERHKTRDRGRETEGQRDQSTERYRDRGRETEGQRDTSTERYRARDRGRGTEGQRDPSSAERYRDIGRETEGQRDTSAERYRARDRGRETVGQRDPSAERQTARDKERGQRETEPQSLRVGAKNHPNNRNRLQHKTKEIQSNKDTSGIFLTSGSSAFSSTYSFPHPHHDQQQQHLLAKKGSSKDRFPSAAHAQNISKPTRKTPVRDGMRDGKASCEDRFVGEKKRNWIYQRSVTGAKSSLHDSSSRDKATTSAGEDKRSTATQSQMFPSQSTAMQNTIRPRSKGQHLSGCSLSMAELDSHVSVTKKDEIIQTDLPLTEVRRMNVKRTGKDEFHEQPKSTEASPLKNHSEYQRQFQWRRPMAPEALIWHQQKQQPMTRLHPRSAISRSHPDFLTLFASDSADKEKDAECRFQFRPISARNYQRTDRGNLAQQLNQLRRVQSLRDLLNDERNEENSDTRAKSVIVRHHHDQPRKYQSEYSWNFQPPWNYQYEDGTWKELEKGRKRNKSKVPSEDVTEEGNRLVRSSSSASSWYEEVLQLRRHAEEYRRRAHGTHFSREQLEQLYARNIDLRDTVFSSSLSQNDASRRRNASSAVNDSPAGHEVRQRDEWRTEDEGCRRGKDGKREQTRVYERASGRPMRHHFDRASHQHLNLLKRRQDALASSQEDACDSSELCSATETVAKSPHHVTIRETKLQERESHDERRRGCRPASRVTRMTENQGSDDRQTPLSALSSTDEFRSTHGEQLARSTDSVLSEITRDNRRKKRAAEPDSVSKEDKSVQVNCDGGTAFKSNRQKIISSSTLATEVLERARSRNDRFWSK